MRPLVIELFPRLDALVDVRFPEFAVGLGPHRFLTHTLKRCQFHLARDRLTPTHGAISEGVASVAGPVMKRRLAECPELLVPLSAITSQAFNATLAACSIEVCRR